MKSTVVARYIMPVLFVFQLLLVFVQAACAGEEPIKVGILHSLSGTMAISESVLKDTVRMLIEDQNKKGGLLGRKLEPIIVDPESDWDLFAEKARDLLAKEKVAVVFGCWTSASRKSVLPIFEQLNGLLFYPVQYTACYFTRCNMKAKRVHATSSTLELRQISKQFRPFDI